MSTTKGLTNALLKSKMTDAMVARGGAADVNQFIPGVFYVTSATQNLPPGCDTNGILENVPGVSDATIGIQRITERKISPKIFTRCVWQGLWTSWSMTQLTVIS